MLKLYNILYNIKEYGLDLYQDFLYSGEREKVGKADSIESIFIAELGSVEILIAY